MTDHFNIEDKRKEYRLQAIKDCIYYNLEYQKIEFNKESIEEMLVEIKNEAFLMRLQREAARVSNISAFIYKVNKQIDILNALDKVSKVKKMLDSNVTIKEIAVKMDIDEETVREINAVLKK
jgi:hypothetical protein